MAVKSKQIDDHDSKAQGKGREIFGNRLKKRLTGPGLSQRTKKKPDSEGR